MNKSFTIFLILSIFIIGISCVCAADVDDVDAFDSFQISEEYVDTENPLNSDDSDVFLGDDVNTSDSFQISEEYVDTENPLNSDGSDVFLGDDVDDGAGESGGDGENDEVIIKGPTIVVKNNDTDGNSSKTPKIGPYVDSGDKEIPVIPVNTPGTFAELQLLINNAKEGSTLYLTKNYYGNKGAKILINKNLIINGLGCYINCLEAEDCFAFFSIMGDVTLKNLNIINGRNDDNQKGGAIYIGGFAKYTLINCQFINNWAEDYGGAIYNEAYLPLTIKKCTFRGNTADDDDGGAIFSKGPLYVENSTFESNKVDDYGGAIYIESEGASTFKNCIFKSNVAGDDNGGAIFSKGDLNIENCLFDSNKARVDGGAVYSNKIVNVIGSVFKNNAATGATATQCYGGAICSKETVNIENSTFENNTSDDYGGAVYAQNVTVNQIQSNLTSFFLNNSARDNNGGAIWAKGYVVMSNSKLLGNTAYEDGGAIFGLDVTAKNCEFIENKATGAIVKCYGGAIFGRGNVTLYATDFNCNYADNYGGAIACRGLNVIEGEHCKFKNNTVNYGNSAGIFSDAYYSYYVDSEVYIRRFLETWGPYDGDPY